MLTSDRFPLLGEDMTRQFAIWDQSKQSVRVTSINQDSIYLSASTHYLGNKRSSYSRVLSFKFKVADTANLEFTPKDIILVSKDGLTISTSLTAQGKLLVKRIKMLFFVCILFPDELSILPDGGAKVPRRWAVAPPNPPPFLWRHPAF